MKYYTFPSIILISCTNSKNSIFAIMKGTMMTFNKMMIPVKKPYTCCKKSLQRPFC